LMRIIHACLYTTTHSKNWQAPKKWENIPRGG